MLQDLLRPRLFGFLLGLGLLQGPAPAATARDLPPTPAPFSRPGPASWLVLAAAGLGGLLCLRMGESEPGEADPDPAARARDEDMLRKLGDLVSACPSCDRVLGNDEVWYRAASWMSLRSKLPRSTEPCPTCARNTNSS